jgi:hypothetical protein
MPIPGLLGAQRGLRVVLKAAVRNTANRQSSSVRPPASAHLAGARIVAQVLADIRLEAISAFVQY